jgi:hypothetical protein
MGFGHLYSVLKLSLIQKWRLIFLLVSDLDRAWNQRRLPGKLSIKEPIQ